MTRIEQELFTRYPKDLQKVSRLTLSFQERAKIAQSNLKRLYGESIDWEKNLSDYDPPEDIEISVDEIERMLSADREYNQKAQQLAQFFPADEEIRPEISDQTMKQAAEILGFGNNDGLLRWMVKGATPSCTDSQRNLFGILIRSLSDLFIPGFQLTYPGIGTAMTQPMPHYYYRGESRIYGESKPSMWRGNTKLPDHVTWLLTRLRLNEAGLFLDHFDAVQRWNDSSINYLALMQHYGLKTPMIDITGDLMTALFFACCKYENEKWRPLNRGDFESVGSGKRITSRNESSKYGILHRALAETMDMELALSSHADKMVLPVGYQPFMRCKNQYGYMLASLDESYDLYKDRRFQKIRFRHSEEFCRWVFEEMDGGKQVYPHDDIPDITPYLEKINRMHHFSKSSFDMICDGQHADDEQRGLMLGELSKYGFRVLPDDQELITTNRLNRMNKQYPVEKAYMLTGLLPRSRPMLTISDSVKVLKSEEGWFLDI